MTRCKQGREGSIPADVKLDEGSILKTDLAESELN